MFEFLVITQINAFQTINKINNESRKFLLIKLINFCVLEPIKDNKTFIAA